MRRPSRESRRPARDAVVRATATVERAMESKDCRS
jgi:hypothetical protein